MFYWVLLCVDEVNMCVGLGEDYCVLWVFWCKELLVKVLCFKEGWCLV